MTIITKGFTRLDALRLFGLFAILYGVYLYTQPATVALEDDGLFLMSSYFFGIAHPPGYPLYTLLSGLFGQLPLGSFPARMHAFSGLFATLSCVMLSVYARQLSLTWPAALGVGLLYGFSLTFWSQAIIAEVYTLNAFLVISLLLLATVIHQTAAAADKAENEIETSYLLYLFALLFGLALSVHVPLLVLSLPTCLLLLWSARNSIVKRLGRLLLFACAGLLPYLWMVWRSNSDVVINFYGPIQSLTDFLTVFSRRSYVNVDISPTAGLADKLAYLQYLCEQLIAQFTLVGLVLAIIGFILQWSYLGKVRALALTLLFLLHSFFFLLVIYFDYDLLSRAVFSVYPMLAYAVMAVWIGIALSVIVSSLLDKLKQGRHVHVVMLVLFAILVATVVLTNFKFNNRHDYVWADEFSRSVLLQLPENADLFVSGDIHTFTLGYMHHVEKVRPDIRVYSFQGSVFSNRLFNPVVASESERLLAIEQHVLNTARPVCTVEAITAEQKQVDHGLFSCFEQRQSEPYRLVLSDMTRAYVSQVWNTVLTDNWSVYHRQQLIKKIATSLGIYFAVNRRQHEFITTLPDAMRTDYFFQLGYLEGLNRYVDDVPVLNEMIRVIKQVAIVPALTKKHEVASLYHIRGDVSVMASNLENAEEEYQRSIAAWPNRKNPSIPKLLGIYRKQGQDQAYSDLKNRFL